MYYGWRIAAVALLAMGLSNGLTAYSYGLLVLPVGTEFGANRMQMMWGLTAASLTTILISPLVGSLMDRRSARLLFSIGAVFLAIALVLIAASRSVWYFVLSFGLVMSVGAAILGPIGSNTLVSRWFSRQRARALGITALGNSVGGLLLPLLLQTLIDSHGWRAACLLLAGIVLMVMLPPVWLIVRNRPADLGLHPDGGMEEAPVPGAGAGAQAAPLPNLMTNVAFWRIALTAGAVMSAFTVILANLVPYAIGHGIAAKQAALLVSTVSVAGITGKVLFSVYADRINLTWSLLVSLAMLWLPLIALVLFRDYWVLLLAAASVGLASGAFLPAWGALLARIFGPDVFGRVMGRMQPIAIAMVTISVPLSGHLFDLSGSYSASFLTMAGLTAFAFVGLLPMRHETRAQEARVVVGPTTVRP
jgi:MFS family permease